MNEAKVALPYAHKEIKVTLSDENRFWNKVDKSGGPDACWLWSVGKNDKGYGMFLIDGQRIRAHRIAWALSKGSIPNDDSYHGLCVLHRCDVPACCNPSHLFLGTNADNVADRESKHRNCPGEVNVSAKLTNKQALEIRALYSVGDTTYNKLASQFGVSKITIKSIIRRETWKHLHGKECFVARTRVIRGEASCQAKLNTAKVLEIRARYKTGEVTYSQLARQFGVNFSTISDVIHYEAWKHILDPSDPLHDIW